MKRRIVSLVMVFALLFTMTSITGFSATSNDVVHKEYLYKHLVKDNELLDVYEELYYHYVAENNPESEIDWSIVRLRYPWESPLEYTAVVANRVISVGSICYPFSTSYAIYDAQLNEVVDIEKADISRYPDFEKGLEEAKVGNPFGDADRDSKLTILDSTFIQSALAQKCEFSVFDETYYKVDGVALRYISDFDRDGERTVMDATAIQLKLAEVE